jgi:hypothetical protein
VCDKEPTVILIIKRGMTQAVDAATQRGVPIQQSTQNPEFNEVICKTRREYLPVVMDWFNEGPFEVPFPAGSLLWYGVNEEEAD